ncbi:MAG TPA: CotH kinase family protein, partial [Planctomycetota bacterium]|nr:CotH kinase family protein [Planctomycetota bacterium]
VDIDALLTFVAMEQIVGHWDGYTLRHNNYRLYFEPGSDKAYFIPHGMDQTFGDPTASVFPQPVGMVAVLLLRNPEWQHRYRERVRALVPLFDAGQLQQRVEAVTARLQPLLQAIGPAQAAAHLAQVRQLEARLAARALDLQRQAALPEPTAPAFDAAGVLPLAVWRPAHTHDDAELQELQVDGERCLGIAVGKSGRCSAAWHTEVVLPRGRYELQAMARTVDVAASVDGKLSGARVRAGSVHAGPLTGTDGWRPLRCAFEVSVGLGAVELAAELRAVRGQVSFQLGALRLQRLLR